MMVLKFDGKEEGDCSDIGDYNAFGGSDELVGFDD